MRPINVCQGPLCPLLDFRSAGGRVGEDPGDRVGIRTRRILSLLNIHACYFKIKTQFRMFQPVVLSRYIITNITL